MKVLELLASGDKLLVRAGVNWNPGVVGHAKIPAHEGSAAGHALLTSQPVITEDTEREDRFEIPKLLIEHSVRSTVNVVIRGEGGPFGVLEVDLRQLRKFDQDDIDFLQNYANLLASAIDRVRIQRELAERALRQEMLGHELQHRINNVLATIQAIARRTRAKSQSLDEFAKAFDDRLAAIARTHALLSRTRTSTNRYPGGSLAGALSPRRCRGGKSQAARPRDFDSGKTGRGVVDGNTRARHKRR